VAILLRRRQRLRLGNVPASQFSEKERSSCGHDGMSMLQFALTVPDIKGTVIHVRQSARENKMTDPKTKNGRREVDIHSFLADALSAHRWCSDHRPRVSI